MNPPAWKEAPAVFVSLNNDPDIRAIIVAGKGSGFCAGIDLLSMTSEIPELMDPAQKGGIKWQLLEKIYSLQETITCIEKCKKPVIAAVHGYCIGAGLERIKICSIYEYQYYPVR